MYYTLFSASYDFFFISTFVYNILYFCLIRFWIQPVPRYLSHTNFLTTNCTLFLLNLFDYTLFRPPCAIFFWTTCNVLQMYLLKTFLTEHMDYHTNDLLDNIQCFDILTLTIFLNTPSTPDHFYFVLHTVIWYLSPIRNIYYTM